MPARTTTTVSTPGFIADYASLRRLTGRQVDWANVPEKYRTTPGQDVVLSAAAALGAVSLAVNALEQDLPSGTMLYFGEAGEYARTTADAAAGATAVPVEAIPAALEAGDRATVRGSGDKHIPAGTPVAEIDASGLIVPRGRGGATAGRTTVGILTTDANENAKVEALSGYGVLSGAVVFEQLLPPNSLDATVKGELAGLPGGGIAFEQFSDNRAS